MQRVKFLLRCFSSNLREINYCVTPRRDGISRVPRPRVANNTVCVVRVFSRAHATPGNAWAFQTPKGSQRRREPGLQLLFPLRHIDAKLNAPVRRRRILLIRLQKGAVATRAACNSWIVGYCRDRLTCRRRGLEKLRIT